MESGTYSYNPLKAPNVAEVGAAPLRQVPSAFMDWDKAFEALQMQLGSLEEHLASVLAAEPPTPSAPPKAPALKASNVPLAIEILQRADRLREVSQRLVRLDSLCGL